MRDFVAYLVHYVGAPVGAGDGNSARELMDSKHTACR